MKALSYLEYSLLEWNDSDGVEEYFQLCKQLSSGLHIINFYSQPFKPELITELFEGWEKSIDSYYFNKASTVIFDKMKMEIYVIKDKIATQPQSRTLDDFINDIQRAGIELIWRGE